MIDSFLKKDKYKNFRRFTDKYEVELIIDGNYYMLFVHANLAEGSSIIGSSG